MLQGQEGQLAAPTVRTCHRKNCRHHKKQAREEQHDAVHLQSDRVAGGGAGKYRLVGKLNLLHLHSHRVAVGGAGKYRLVGKLNDTLKFKVTVWPEVGQVNTVSINK